jgi:hypothetical protein
MLRGRFPSRGMMRGPVVEVEDEAPPRPVRAVTPIYPRDPSVNHALKPQGPKLARDRLSDMFRDQRFHAAVEMEELLPHGVWVAGLRELLALSYAFDRVDNHLRMRFRAPGEPRQVLVELLAGLDATVTTGEAPAEEALDGTMEGDFDPTGDQGQPSEGLRSEGLRTKGDLLGDQGSASQGGMVISDPPEALTLSPANSVSMTAAILAKKNSGKTYLAMVLAEEFMASNSIATPVVVLDPTGVWFGLRSMADGQPSPYNILGLGGRYGDIPVTSKDGAKAALVVNAIRPHPIVIDLSLLAPVEQHEFVADFVEKLFTTAERSPIHIIIDEVDEFAPQTLNSASRHQKRSLDAIDRLVRRGRSKGIGVTMITQRSAVIAKNVLSQIDSLWLLNMVEPRDLLAVEGWLRHGVSDRQKTECLNQIPKLQPGMAYFLQTGVSPKFRRFKVRRKKTFDSSKTPGARGYAEPIFSKPLGPALAAAKELFRVEVVGDDKEQDAEASIDD